MTDQTQIAAVSHDLIDPTTFPAQLTSWLVRITHREQLMPQSWRLRRDVGVLQETGNYRRNQEASVERMLIGY